MKNGRFLKRILILGTGLFLWLGSAFSVWADPETQPESQTETASHEHDYEWLQFSSDENRAAYIQDANFHYAHCTICGMYDPNGVPHGIHYELASDPSSGCRKHCNVCGYEGPVEPHEPDREAPDAENPVLCKNCGYLITPNLSSYVVTIRKSAVEDERDGFLYVDFADEPEPESAAEKKRAFAVGEEVRLVIRDPETPSIYTVTELILYRQSSSEIEDSLPVNGKEEIVFTMPEYDLFIQVFMEIDEEKAEESEAEESRSIEESITEESRRKESEAEARRFRYGHYLVEPDVSEVEHPGDFLPAWDESMGRLVDCFYHASYNVMIFYASEDGTNYGFYVHDPIGRDLIPYTTFYGTGNNSYVVSAPKSIAVLEETIEKALSKRGLTGTEYRYLGEQSAVLPLTSPGPVEVPVYLTEIDGDELKLLFLHDDSGNRDFHIFLVDGKNVELPELGQYLENKKTGKKEDSGIVISTMAPGDTVPTAETGISKRLLTWLIIIGVIVVLITAALITVFLMSRQQEAKERELDEEEDAEEDEDGEDDSLPEEPEEETPVAVEEDETPEPDFGTSTYKAPDPTDMNDKGDTEGFDFENAFPEGFVDTAPTHSEKEIPSSEIDPGTPVKLPFEDLEG